MSSKSRLVVVGNGMAGARLVEDVLARGGDRLFDVVVFGDEPHGNYNRILLSGVLAGSLRPEDIVINSLEWYASRGVTLHAGVRVAAIDPTARVVRGENGLVEHFDTLVIATGSRPSMPPIEGLSRAGVFVFRTIDDCARILERAKGVSTAAVIGGGLLGIEAAAGLVRHGLTVHLIHLPTHLMEVQLDPDGGAVLQHALERQGMRVHLGKVTTAVRGNGHVEGLAFRDGTDITCDLVVVAAGIRPNVELASAAGLRVGRGIVVGDDLACPETDDIYAIGECAEHRGQVYGLVAPLWEQAATLADRLTGKNASAVYEGSRLSTKLKVAGVDVAVMGLKDAVEDDDEIVKYAEPSRGVYKKLVIRNGRLAGAIVIGDHAVIPPLTQAFTQGAAIADTRAELLFPMMLPATAAPPVVDDLPNEARVCDCNSVSKAEIVSAVLSGARSLQAVCDATRAGTGCGTCRPEVQRIIEFACRGSDDPGLLVITPPEPAIATAPDIPSDVVATNKIERIKQTKDGLDVLADVPLLAAGGWEAIPEDERERLKWTGVFFRRQTPGKFMMRVRISNGLTNAAQLSAIADLSEEFGNSVIDITTRQQVQVRGFAIEHVPEIWRRLDEVGLVSLQTGMDNIRNVIGCPLAGLTPNELFDASPVVQEFTAMFLRNKAFTNLPRKFNVGITGCTENCTDSETQDLALTPAYQDVDGQRVVGFNVAVGGKVGSGGCRFATPLDVFVDVNAAASYCAHIVEIFRDHGKRGARNRVRLAFLVDSWGAQRFRNELQSRVGHALTPAGRDARVARTSDHLGLMKQKQLNLHAIGLAVPVGRLSAQQLRSVAELSATCASGEVRLTTTQNVVIPNVHDDKVQTVLSHPIVAELPHDPHGAFRGLVACTGIDYCHFALIETKDLAVRTAKHLEMALPHHQRFSTHWSGCPAGCGNHTGADIGLLGKNLRVGNEVVDAVDVYIGGRTGSRPRAGVKILEDVPCDQLPQVLERLIPYAPS